MKETQSEKSDLEYRNGAAHRIGAKIIPFPGVSLPDNRHREDEAPDQFQNELDDFLRELGYIE